MRAEPSADEKHLIALMTGYQQGSMDDFAALYAELEKPLGRYLWTFVRNRPTADDLLQEVFLQVHRARHTYTPPRPVRPWVYAISRHVALMYLRSRRRRPEDVPREDLPEVPVEPSADVAGDRATLMKLLDTLPRASQEVLVLHHLLGLSFEEVGRIVGASAGTAKVRAHRAFHTLRRRVADGGEAR